MSGKSLVQIDTLRSLDFSLIGAGYVAVGSALSVNARIICLTNATEGDMLFTTNTSVDQFFIAKGSFKLLDLQSNMNAQFDDQYVGPIGWRFYVKQITAPVSGKVYLEVVY